MENKNEKRQSQEDKIYQYMLYNGSITPIEALREYGCMRLAPRISDLKRRGVKIKREYEHSLNMNGERVRYARYSIEK